MTEIYRNYLKIQETLSLVGGITKFLLTLAQGLSYYYSISCFEENLFKKFNQNSNLNKIKNKEINLQQEKQANPIIKVESQVKTNILNLKENHLTQKIQNHMSERNENENNNKSKLKKDDSSHFIPPQSKIDSSQIILKSDFIKNSSFKINEISKNERLFSNLINFEFNSKFEKIKKELAYSKQEIKNIGFLLHFFSCLFRNNKEIKSLKTSIIMSLMR